MRYAIPAVLLVAAIIAGLLFMPERWGEGATVVNESGTKLETDFVDLPPPDAPDYSTVVTDEALAQELASEAEGYLEELSGPLAEALAGVGGESPVLRNANSKLEIGNEEVRVGDLLNKYGIPTNEQDLYYVHAVEEDDDQGVWGIVQGGLIARFANGIAVRRGESVKTYTLLIPKHADERNYDGTSSFLGKVIWHKTVEAQVINTQQGWSRTSADLVVPNQDTVIVTFKRQELVAVYQYFATEGS